jgi:hypothetical protein
MAKTRQHDAEDEADVQENDGGLQYAGQEHSDAEQQN